MENVEQKQGSTWSVEYRCGCGAPRRAWRPVCVACANRHRRTHAELSPEARRRANARSYLNQYLRRGKIVRQPCAECGAAEVEAHHADYARPLEVTWLCRECHLRRHDVACVRRARRSKADGPAVKPPAMYAFYRALHARGESTENLARQLHVSGAVVRKLLGLLRRRAGPRWLALQALLTAEERQLLVEAAGAPEWNLRQAAKPAAPKPPVKPAPKITAASVLQKVNATKPAGAKPAKSAGKKAAKKTRTVITDDTRYQVKRLVESGRTGAEIAKQVGISLPSVQNIKKAFGLVRR